MKILTRYILAAHLPAFLFALGALGGVLGINVVARLILDLAERGVPRTLLLRVSLLSAVPVLTLATPMAAFVAVLYVFARFAADNEIVSLKASGLDLRLVALPIVAAGCLLAVVLAVFNATLLPMANRTTRDLLAQEARTRPLGVLHEGRLNRIGTSRGPALFLTAERIEAVRGEMREVSIYEWTDTGALLTVHADSARFSFHPPSRALRIHLYSGRMYYVDSRDPGQFTQVAFTEHGRTFALPQPGKSASAPANGYTPRETPSSALRREARSLAREIRSAPVPSEPKARRELRKMQRRLRAMLAEIQKRYVISAAVAGFVLLGAPLGARLRGSGVGIVSVVGCAVFAGYYVVLIAGNGLALSGAVPPAPALWLANAVLLALGIGFYARFR